MLSKIALTINSITFGIGLTLIALNEVTNPGVIAGMIVGNAIFMVMLILEK